MFGLGKNSQETDEAPVVPARKRAHIIMLGNEKGGCGKTTSSMHLIVGLLRLGFKVGSIDIDSRQRSLSRYIENRRETMTRHNVTLPVPHHIIVQKSQLTVLDEAQNDERRRFDKAMGHVIDTCDFVIVDGPGNDTYLARLAHSYADTVITPINDSFVDLDLLAQIDPQTLKVVRPSIYSEMLWEQKLARAKRDGRSLDWIVMRNRLSNIDARNKRHMNKAVEELSKRIGFRNAPGFSERVIFRELFLQGLTVFDVMESKTTISATMSHVAAKNEVRALLKFLNIPAIDEKLNAGKSPDSPMKEGADGKGEDLGMDTKEEKKAAKPSSSEAKSAEPMAAQA